MAVVAHRHASNVKALVPLDITIGVSASALFDMRKADAVFREQGEAGYKRYMEQRVDKALQAGAALSFIKKMMKLNGVGNIAVHAPILSRMHPFAQQRIHKSLIENDLGSLVNDARFSPGSVYTGGRPLTARNLDAMNVDLFLSTNEVDVRMALAHGVAAAVVSSEPLSDKALGLKETNRIVIGYDYCRVLGASYGLKGDSFTGDSEDFYKSCFAETKDPLRALEMYRQREIDLAGQPSDPGPWAAVFLKMCAARDRLQGLPQGCSTLTSIENRIVTMRDMGAMARIATTLKGWGAEPDQIMSCGMTSKAHYVEDVDLYADDSYRHIEAIYKKALAGYVPWEARTLRGAVLPRFAEASAVYRRQKKYLESLGTSAPARIHLPETTGAKPYIIKCLQS